MPAAASKVDLTDKFLRALKPAPAGRRTTIWDAKERNLAVRVTDRGAVSFALVRRVKGRAQPSWVTLGRYPEKTLKDARDAAREAAGLLRKGEHPRELEDRARAEAERERREAERAEEAAGASTFAAVAEQFIAWYAETPGRDGSLRRRAADTAGDIRRELVPEWGARQLSSITTRDVRKLMQAIIDRRPAPGSKQRTGGPNAARHALAAARLLFKWALRREMIAADPCTLIDPMELHGAPAARDRVLADDELRVVWRAAERTSYPYGPLVKLLLLTGARLREVAEASWSEVDVERGVLTIPTTRMKGKVAHTIPLTAMALAVFDKLPRFQGGDFLFSTHTGGRGSRADGRRPISGFSKYREKFDVTVAAVLGDGTVMESWTIHDLRRTVRTNLSTLKVPPHVAEMVIGHRQQGIAKVYDLHRYDDEKRDALEQWERRLLSVVDPQPAPANVVPLRA